MTVPPGCGGLGLAVVLVSSVAKRPDDLGETVEGGTSVDRPERVVHVDAVAVGHLADLRRHQPGGTQMVGFA
jgi:hypothetical protein